MLPVPQHLLLNHYFTWLRLPATMLVLLPAPASDLQGTEPLPRWALASRVFHQPVLVHLGIMCYGRCSMVLAPPLQGRSYVAAPIVACPALPGLVQLARATWHVSQHCFLTSVLSARRRLLQLPLPQVSIWSTGHWWFGLATIS